MGLIGTQLTRTSSTCRCSMSARPIAHQHQHQEQALTVIHSKVTSPSYQLWNDISACILRPSSCRRRRPHHWRYQESRVPSFATPLWLLNTSLNSNGPTGAEINDNEGWFTYTRYNRTSWSRVMCCNSKCNNVSYNDQQPYQYHLLTKLLRPQFFNYQWFIICDYKILSFLIMPILYYKHALYLHLNLTFLFYLWTNTNIITF